MFLFFIFICFVLYFHSVNLKVVSLRRRQGLLVISAKNVESVIVESFITKLCINVWFFFHVVFGEKQTNSELYLVST